MVKRRLSVAVIVAVVLSFSLVGQAFALDIPIIIPGPIFVPWIEIRTVQQLKDVSKNLDGSYVLKADIDLGNVSWEPISTEDTSGFRGKFDGNGFTISGLRADKGYTRGLFSRLGEGAVVTNITVKGTVTAQESGGLVAGVVLDGATIDGCTVEGIVTKEGHVTMPTGGVAGFNYGTIKDCTASVQIETAAESGGIVGGNRGTIVSSRASGDVSATVWAGGIAGTNDGTISDSTSSVRVFSQSGQGGGVSATNTGIIERSAATGSVVGAHSTGGLVGSNTGQIISSSASGTVTGTTSVGGLAGYAAGGTIRRSYANGAVSGNESVGGLVGYTAPGATPLPNQIKPVVLITDSYAVGAVTGQEHVGGLIGQNTAASVQRAYAAGKVTGVTNVAGLVGSTTGPLTFVATRWDTQTTGRNTAIGGAAGTMTGIMGLTTQAMRDPASYEGWDFNTVWGIDAGQGYPQLSKPGIHGQVVSFTDTKGHWAEAEILQLANSGVVSGIGGGRFNPDGSVTRAEFAKMIVLGLGLAPQAAPKLQFADTATIPDWAHGYVATAVAEGIIKGLDGNRFGPSQLITREQIAVMVVRASSVTPAGSLSVEDAAATSDWARAEVQAALEHGMLLRRDASGAGSVTGSLLPQAFGTRAEAARAIARLQLLLAGR